MKSEEIIILCNSKECLNIITQFDFLNLTETNIFTCNLAYSFFRTKGRHLNIFSDAIPVKTFLECKNWSAVYETYQYDKIEFLYSTWELSYLNIPLNQNPEIKANIKPIPFSVPASSGINALLYSALVLNYGTIYLVGYTINEWEGISQVKELQPKKQILDELLNKYNVNQIMPFVYKYKIKG